MKTSILDKKTNKTGLKTAPFQTSWYSGKNIDTTPQKLIDLCKKYDIPYSDYNNGEDKSNFDFDFEASDGSYFTVYDWKEYRKLDLNETISFHIGCNNNTDVNNVLNELKTELNNLK